MITKIRFTLILLFSITCFHSYCQEIPLKASKEVIRFNREIEKTIKKHSIVAGHIDWAQIAKTLDTLTIDGNEDINKKNIIRVYTKALRDKGDKHSFFRTTAQIQNRKNRDSTTIFSSSKYLGENVGYILVPGFSSYNQETIRKFANTIRNQIQELDTTYIIKSWVVDLRNNGGGNMWPMIAGINSLVEDGVAGYFLSSKYRGKRPWIIRNGIINYTKLAINDYKIKQSNIKIAVLINKNTGSSGEMTAISLIGLPNSRTFGQPTAGYTTANSRIILEDSTELYLATGYCADRNNKKYFNEIVPDTVVALDSPDENDVTLEEAKKWLAN